jgi:prolyl oligopeptidase
VRRAALQPLEGRQQSARHLAPNDAAEFRSDPQWETLLDVDRLAADEGADWLLNWTQTRPGTQSRAILGLSRGGSDAVALREFDMNTCTFVAGGFVLPEAKGSVDWLDADTLLLSSAFGEGMASASGYARTVRQWRRGEDAHRAPVIFETSADHMGVHCTVDDTGPTPRIWIVDQLDFFNFDIWLSDGSGARVKLDVPTGVWLQANQDWFVVKLRTAWTVAGRTYAPDTVIGMSLSAFLAGERNFTIVFEPSPRRALQGLFWAAGKLVLPILDELRPVFEVCTPSPDGWSRERLQGLPEIGVVDVWRLDRHQSEANGDLLANVQGPLTPPALAAERWSSGGVEAGAGDIRSGRADVTQHEISVDGAHSVCADRARHGGGDAPSTSGLRRLRLGSAPALRFGAWQAVAETAARVFRRTSVAAASSAPLARCRPLRRQGLAHDDFAAVAADP